MGPEGMGGGGGSHVSQTGRQSGKGPGTTPAVPLGLTGWDRDEGPGVGSALGAEVAGWL